VEGHFKGNEDLTIQQIRDRLLVAARDERLAREDCAYSMVDRLTAASDALVTIVEQLNEV
jgi:bisphosphoglycerate-independent phosphoglycerate mutase (AlkP superfamily)